MTADELLEVLAAGRIARLSREDWDRCADAFEVVEEHDTRLRGSLLVVESRAGLAAVEEPTPTERAVRPLASAAATQAFVADRLATYERMWDGCGCRIDYDR